MDGRFLIIVLALLVIVGAALFIGNTDAISAETAKAQVELTVPGPIGTAAGTLAGGLTSTLAKIFLTSVVVAIAGVIIHYVNKWLESRRKPGAWVSGPNANFQRQPRQTSLDNNQLFLLQMIQMLNGTRSTRIPPPAITMDDEDETPQDMEF